MTLIGTASALFGQARSGFIDPDAAFRQVVDSYAEPHRHYHTLDHIVEMLHCFEECRHLAREPAAVILAIWYHDIVYDVTATGGANEAASAERLARAAEGSHVAAACRMIRHSAHHGSSDDTDTQLFCDLDLYRLGAPEFPRHNDDIRAEYAHVPDDFWRRRRVKFLQSMLDRPVLYQSAFWHQRLEAPARANLARVIAELRAS